MNKAISIIIGLVLAGAVLGFFVSQSLRKSPTGQSGVTPVPSNVLQSDVSQKINQREVNGQIPVQAAPEHFGRDDPFADF